MSEIAIQAEGVGKCYLVGHHDAERERYTALRDVMARGARNLARTTRDMLRGRPVVQGDSVEEFWALRDISFEIRQGDRVGIIGRNGAGKSTLLKVLSRITEPTRGQIKIRGRVASLLEVGTGFHPELSGRENVFLNGAILGMTRREIQRKFDEIVEFAEVEKFLDTPVKRYSSGMYVRLAFSVAAHLEPEILIVDEVLAVGDAQFQKKCLGKMEDVGKDGRTVIFVSHNMAAIRQLCSTAILLRGGQLLSQCDSESAVARYMEQGVERAGHKLWAQGLGTELKLLSVTLVDSSGEVKSNFTSHGDIHIVMRYRVESAVEGAQVAFVLSTVDGVAVLTSQDGDAPGASARKEPGEYSARATLPRDFLNEGDYFLSFACHVPMVRILYHEDNVLCFSVKNIDGVGGFVDDKRRGVTRPRLDWRTAVEPVRDCAVLNELAL